ncbi:MAG: hypothetical protein AAFO94_06555 [Bacteroidota bacterium]
MKQKNNLYRRWMVQAVAGLIVMSAGLCIVVEAAFLKHDPEAAMSWMVAGTVALIVFNAGVCLLIDSLKYRIRYEQEQ